MLVKRTSKNQFTLPKALLKAAGIEEKDHYFDAKYDERRHIIFLKPVQVIVEETIPQKTLEKFEEEALKEKPGDEIFSSRKEADAFLRQRMKK